VKKKQDISPVQFLLALVGVIAWIIAGYFGSQATVKTTTPKPPTPGVLSSTETVTVEQPNIAAAGAACGFAIGGGLCFLAVGIGGWKSGNGQPPTTPPSRSNEG
jgi:hypothetical protein